MSSKKEYRSSENWNRCYFYRDWAEAIRDLPDEEQLTMYRGFVGYAFWGKEPSFTSPYAKMAWKMMRAVIDSNRKKYDETCERNRENGKNGGRPPKEPPKNIETQSVTEEPTETQPVIEKPSGCQSNPPKPDNYNYNEIDNENENENESESEKGEGENTNSAKKVNKIYQNLDPEDAEMLLNQYGSNIFRKALIEAYDDPIAGGELLGHIQSYCEQLQRKGN